MKTPREIIAAAICMNRFGFEIIEGEREEADAILAALSAEGFSIVETGLVEQAFRDGVAYGTVCDVTDVDKAWEVSAVRARSEGKP